MAENTYKSNTFKKPEKEKRGRGPKSKSRISFEFLKDPRLILATGFFLIITSLYLFVAFLSYLFTGKADQSVVEDLSRSGIIDWGKEAQNWLGLGGAWISHIFIFKYMGIAAFFIPPMLFLSGLKLVSRREPLPIFSVFIFSVFAGLWLCLLLGYMTHSISGITEVSFLSGGLGYQLALISDGLFGWGTLLILVLSLFIFIIFYFNVTAIRAFHVRDPKPMGNDALLSEEDGIKPTY
ncbi:MAG TPA: DNA translocase FtsK 4TM domain-containing protein, partial [Cyclobacteriaceae bacterium]|nr:DNA translocase FtsK 4TM domain-containing protein [Cyclobacteriaceae bacterium]